LKKKIKQNHIKILSLEKKIEVLTDGTMSRKMFECVKKIKKKIRHSMIGENITKSHGFDVVLIFG